MSYPSSYTRQYDYVSYQNSNPSRPLPATKVNADYNAVALSLAETIDFLKTSLRSDGAVMNGAIGYDQLSASLQTAGLSPAAAWVTATAYVVGNSVITNNNLYRCLVSHTSGVFADDLAAAKWVLVAALPVNAYLAGTGLQLNTLTFSIDATVATLSGVQVLTNKTINGSNNTISNLSLSMFAAGAFGTGVAAALAVNVGSAGAPVLFNGALGTPSSANLSNATALPLASITGAGTGVLAALAINVGSAGAPVVLNGALGTPSSGVGSNLTSLNASQLSSGTIPAARTNGHQNGTATNDAAVAGEVGELIFSTIVAGSAVSLTTATAVTITSIALTAGDWDISAQPGVTGNAATTFSGIRASISTTIATENNVAPFVVSASYGGATLLATFNWSGAISPIRVSLSGSQTYYLIIRADFGTNTCAGFGSIRARRVR